MAINEQVQELNVSSASYANKTTLVGQEDIPALSAQAMQESVEYMPRNFIIPVLNKVIRLLNGTYSKTETDEAINAKVAAIGAGDMTKAVYDPKEVVQEAGGIAAYVANEVAPAISGVESAKGVSVALDPSKWSDSAPYTQTVTVSGMTADWKPGIPSIPKSGTVDVTTGLAELEALQCINAISSGTDTLTFICFEDKPTASITVDVPGLLID